jgi:hypothetical protein
MTSALICAEAESVDVKAELAHCVELTHYELVHLVALPKVANAAVGLDKSRTTCALLRDGGGLCSTWCGRVEPTHCTRLFPA